MCGRETIRHVWGALRSVGWGDKYRNQREENQNTKHSMELPLQFDLADVEAYLRGVGISEKNVKDSMKVIRPLVTGAGVANKHKSDLFMAGTKVTPCDDLESIREQSKIWLPKEIDTGHGWVKHGIQKLINYKKERLLGIELKVKPKARVEASLRTEGGGVALGLSVLPKGKAKKPAPKRKREAQAEDPIQKIKEVKSLLDEGAITSEQYEAKKAELLARI